MKLFEDFHKLAELLIKLLLPQPLGVRYIGFFTFMGVFSTEIFDDLSIFPIVSTLFFTFCAGVSSFLSLSSTAFHL